MIAVETDLKGVRTYRLPAALAAVACELFPSVDRRDAFFMLANRASLADLHTAENIAINVSHYDAVRFLYKRL
jgi:hypothetical protein